MGAFSSRTMEDLLQSTLRNGRVMPVLLHWAVERASALTQITRYHVLPPPLISPIAASAADSYHRSRSPKTCGTTISHSLSLRKNFCPIRRQLRQAHGRRPVRLELTRPCGRVARHRPVHQFKVRQVRTHTTELVAWGQGAWASNTAQFSQAGGRPARRRRSRPHYARKCRAVVLAEQRKLRPGLAGWPDDPGHD